MARNPSATAAIMAAVEDALTDVGATSSTRVAVACSGGPDSTVLAHATMALCRDGSLASVVLLHVDHGLRRDSATDAAFVESLAAEGGADFRCVKVTVDTERASLEAAARDARYGALAAMSQDADASWVLLAHTASDQAETVLMRILRGSGIVGLAGIPRRRDRYVRPLLDITREGVEAYLEENELDAIIDPMNSDDRFARTRVRNSWLPQLRSENPQLDAALVRLAAAARDQRDALDFAAELVLERAADGDGLMSVALLREAPAAVLKRALALATVRAGGGPLAARHQEVLSELVQRDEGGTVTLDLPQLQAVRRYDQLSLHRTDRAGQERPKTPEMAVRVDGPDGPYVVRAWEPGDRMRPERLKGRSRKLSDLFIDARIPRDIRAGARVVVRSTDGQIAWAEHLGKAHDANIDVVLTASQPVTTTKV